MILLSSKSQFLQFSICFRVLWLVFSMFFGVSRLLSAFLAVLILFSSLCFSDLASPRGSMRFWMSTRSGRRSASRKTTPCGILFFTGSVSVDLNPRDTLSTFVPEPPQVLVQLAVPSRKDVAEYQKPTREVRAWARFRKAWSSASDRAFTPRRSTVR